VWSKPLYISIPHHRHRHRQPVSLQVPYVVTARERSQRNTIP
jgi:hypothetical protein